MYCLRNCEQIAVSRSLNPGSFSRDGFDIYFGTKSGLVLFKLFRDMAFTDSIRLLFTSMRMYK